MPISDKSPIGYFLEVDLKYPDELQELHNDFSLAPEKIAVSSDMLSKYCKKIADEYEIKVGDVKKLISNLGNENSYVVHHRNHYDELQKINECFISNKLSVNVKKNKYSIFHRPSKKDNIPLVLPKLTINNSEIARTESIKFLGVLLGEELGWKTHIKYIENKISKNKVYYLKQDHS